MQMPRVNMCNATQCAFNRGELCHALAVTIGDESSAKCDTFLKNGSQGGEVNEIAGVGACKVEDCAYNKGLYCTASSIEVEYRAEGPVCVTYSPAEARTKV